VLRAHGKQQAAIKSTAGGAVAFTDDRLDYDDQCLEKRVFYRVISGMHASINAHICWDYLNQSTGTWGPNLRCYEERLHHHPERISNLYFNYALVLRAVTKLRPHLRDYTFCSGDVAQDRVTKQKVGALLDRASIAPAIFDESQMFQDASSPGLKEDFRNRFRNVSRLMDCVGCDKCRLWGKLQTAGYGTALKVLFEFDEKAEKQDNPPLRRTELVALVNTLDRISSSLSAVVNFRQMVEARDQGRPITEEAKNKLFEKQQRIMSVEESEAPHLLVKNGDADDVDDLDDDEEPIKHAPMSLMQELRQAFREETTRVWNVYVYLLKAWWYAPKTL
jgi:hypothetical protein